jgi:hypothetical protein
MPLQTVVALYIYRVERSCLARNPFTARNSQGLLNSARTRGPLVRPVRLVWPLPDWLQDAPPVRPLRDTDPTGGVSLIGLVPNLGANTIFLQQQPICLLASRKIQEARLLINSLGNAPLKVVYFNFRISHQRFNLHIIYSTITRLLVQLVLRNIILYLCVLILAV